MVKIMDYPLLVFLLSFTVMWLSAWLGPFLRRRLELHQSVREDFGLIMAATLTLLGLIIGFSFSMATGRYDQRKNLEEAEANAIGTEYVRADMLPAADGAKVRALLKRYLDQRILYYTTRGEEELGEINVRTARLQAELWSAIRAPARADPNPVMAVVVSGMNDVLNSQSFTQAAWWNRIPAAAALAKGEVKVGFVMFLSGPAASPFGVPAKNAADFVVEELNAGRGPAPYSKAGFGGSKIEMVAVDEAGTTTTVVTEFRNLVQRSKVDLGIGYISSGSCLAIAPVAEELKKLTNFFDCGTPRIFEDGSYKYVFRTSPTATMDSVRAALYVTEAKRGVKSIAGLNQNYAWGQDSWSDFEASMKQLVPGIEVKTSQMPKL